MTDCKTDLTSRIVEFYNANKNIYYRLSPMVLHIGRSNQISLISSWHVTKQENITSKESF